MWPDRVSNPGPLALDPDALPTTPRGLATRLIKHRSIITWQQNFKENLWCSFRTIFVKNDNQSILTAFYILCVFH